MNSRQALSSNKISKFTGSNSSTAFPDPLYFLDGGNSALLIGVFVETNFEASKTLFLKAFWSLKNGLDYSTITKARFPRGR